MHMTYKLMSFECRPTSVLTPTYSQCLFEKHFDVGLTMAVHTPVSSIGLLKVTHGRQSHAEQNVAYGI